MLLCNTFQKSLGLRAMHCKISIIRIAIIWCKAPKLELNFMMTVTDAVIYTCLFTIVLITFSLQSSIKQLEKKIKRMDLSLSLLLNRMEIEVPSQLSDRVKQVALDPYRKLEAIKLYREETGTGLREAKEAIEEFIEHNQ
ncbi:hypothetical protein B9G53_11225 [Pseudanabaena sp. SR411]|nr:hypothetical protein B9G53_11225 [Pseudanabaena sp. SR411]